MITRYDSLNISPEDGKFFLPHEFYLSLKDDIMTEEEYENVKKLYQTMKLKDLGEFNKVFNFQDTIILLKHLYNVLCIYKYYFNITPENVILQFFLVVVSTGTRVSVV